MHSSSQRRHNDWSRWTLRNGVRRCLRPWLAVLILLLAAGLLVADIVVWDGLEPGAKNPYIIDSKPFSEDSETILAWHESQLGDTTYSCTCSYKTSLATTLWGPPYAGFGGNPKVNVTSWRHMLQMVGEVCPTLNMREIDDNTTAGNATMKVMRTMVWDFIQTATLAPPSASLLLTRTAWRSLRLAVTQSRLTRRTQQAETELYALLAQQLAAGEAPEEMARRTQQLRSVLAAYTGVQKYLIYPNKTINNYNLRCDYPTDLTVLPIRLIEVCCYDNNTQPHRVLSTAECAQLQASGKGLEAGCPDPYRAYVLSWCEPELCQSFEKKNAHRRTMEILAAIGGMWGLISLLVMVLWQCCALGFYNHVLRP